MIPAAMNNVKNLEHVLFNLVRLVVLLVRLLRSIVGKWEQVILSLSEEFFFFHPISVNTFFSVTLFWKLSESEIISLLFSSEKKEW